MSEISDFKTVLKTLIEQNTKKELSNREIDIQFSNLIDRISEDFINDLGHGDFSSLLDYISESIKVENELRTKYQFEKARKFTPTNLYVLGLLIIKINLIHVKIISLVVDEILLLYSDFSEIRRTDTNDFDLADELKLTAIKLANVFINYLTENRLIDEKTFDKYINLISQALKVFR